MDRLKYILFTIAILIIAQVIISCNTNGCLENRSSIPLAGFYSSKTGNAISLDSLRITGIGKTDGTAMTEEGTSVSTVYLPMRSTMDETRWQIAYKWKYLDEIQLADTLTFEYSSEPYFASDECGVIYKYHITKMEYTKHLIDSISITDSLITNTDTERIKIYFRTE